MVASQQVEAFGLLALQCEQQTDRLQAMRPSVYLVAQEELIIRINVPVDQVFTRRALQVKEPHEIRELPMNISKYLDRSI